MIASARTVRLAVASLTTLFALFNGTGTAHATGGTGPAAVVSMGDSYISGEAGRWQGNSDDTSGSRDGTDRAYVGGSYDPTVVYGPTYASGCDRSDTAEINSAPGLNATRFNIACSGATTANVLRASDGGQSFKGEAPQADQLARIAASNNVQTVVLSIGGNDLGFTSVITSCVEDYELWYSYCNGSQQQKIAAALPGAMAGVGKAIDSVNAAMASDGYAPGSYRIILQSYPSPIPRSSENRYSESGWARTSTGGCPFWDGDSDWARDTLIPEISSALRNVADAKGVQFLDLENALQGHEVCSTSTQLATPTQAPSAATSEWARFLTTGMTQGTEQESFHPNAYGEQALGHCLSLIAAQSSGDWSCTDTPGEDTSGMTLSAMP
ncbi:GDSL-type esterase/lipase family protein [Streptacidiphilus jiangxiensis]|uniref:GDSL-like Lipase/Acylhydrolase family protein n=1 Tax=Streptacidiphilus jiangxiensis TaxID=235985 RepID=A0A1H7S5V9_STRJI|nr:GDSL-type esterase/lipase family protein [Streptacidiphilus jiangxiensis]SEL68020.1 GDSL-like Lipase/Acylhydrolase family protein [Streptacidiphilus jiangxiensis]